MVLYSTHSTKGIQIHSILPLNVRAKKRLFQSVAEATDGRDKIDVLLRTDYFRDFFKRTWEVWDRKMDCCKVKSDTKTFLSGKKSVQYLIETTVNIFII